MAAPTTLDQIITEACELFAPGDSPTRYYTAALIHAKAWRRRFLTSTSRETKRALMQVGNDRTADLPDDYVQYERLGILNEAEGHIYDLNYTDVAPTTSPATTGHYPCDWYGLGGFEISREQHRIICNSLVPEHTLLVLDYKSFSAKDGEDIAIDPLAHSWAVKYILAELQAQKKDWASHARAAADRDQEYELYKQGIRNLSLAGIIQVNHAAAAQRWK